MFAYYDENENIKLCAQFIVKIWNTNFQRWNLLITHPLHSHQVRKFLKNIKFELCLFLKQ